MEKKNKITATVKGIEHSLNHENVHLNFNGLGCMVEFSLNISMDLLPYLSSNNIYKADKFYIYLIKKQVNVVNSFTLNKTIEQLKFTAMINLREAKIKLLEKEKNELRNKIEQQQYYHYYM